MYFSYNVHDFGVYYMVVAVVQYNNILGKVIRLTFHWKSKMAAKMTIEILYLKYTMGSPTNFNDRGVYFEVYADNEHNGITINCVRLFFLLGIQDGGHIDHRHL